MIKRVPYTSNLIPIGNAPVGSTVYSDGNVAYGWCYHGGVKKPPVADYSGFWVGEQTTAAYQLARADMTLGRRVGSHSHGIVQCYPCWATIESTAGYLPEHGLCVTSAGAYEYDGAIVTIDSAGGMVTYDDYHLYWYTPGAQRQDSNGYLLYIADIAIYSDTTLLYHDRALYATNGGIVYVYDTAMALIATIQGDTVNYNYHGVQYTGDGTIKILQKHAFLSVQIDDTDISGLRSPDGIWAIDGIRYDVDGTILRYVVQQHEYSTDVRRIFQLATTNGIYLLALTPNNGNTPLRYHITTAGITQINAYPTTWQAGTDVVLRLADMALLVTTQQGVTIYGNDPLGLLTTQDFVYPAGVHAYQDYVISQDSGILWHNAQSKTYQGIAGCYSLAWLKKRWK